MNLKEIYLAGIEQTEKERIERGTPPDTEWLREHYGLPAREEKNN